MPTVRGMHSARTAHERAVRDALARLGTAHSPTARPVDATPPLFLRAPWIVALWGAALLAVAALLAIARIRVPQVVRAPAVAVAARADSIALVLLLSPALRSQVHAGQRAELDTGTGTVAVTVLGVDSLLLDAASARSRFTNPASLVAQLDAPKLVVRLARCGTLGCLTPHVGETYAAAAFIDARSLASHAMRGF